MPEVRTRIAPSPTGAPHLGTAYIALFNFCFARKNKGRFFLRIEDTDRARSEAGYERAILEALRWLGLDWDGEPRRQSEHADYYRQCAEQLVEKGHAFYCFATEEELRQMRAEQMAKGETARYDGRALKLSDDEVKSKLAAGEPHVIRLKVPQEGECVFTDTLRGEVAIPWRQVDMQVLLKADGLPTYHLANVADDRHMEITHVIRGEEWINSTPKHILLYQGLGWEPPEFCHLPLLRNPDKSKLSKRKNHTGILYYRRVGYLPEALVNFLGRMGWAMPDEREVFSLDEMISHFDLSRVSTGGPIFDGAKLRWLNQQHLMGLADGEIERRLYGWAAESVPAREFIGQSKQRAGSFSDMAALGDFLFRESLELGAEDFAGSKHSTEEQLEILQCSLWLLEGKYTRWNKDEIFSGLKGLASARDSKMGDFLAPLFVALTGKPASISLPEAMEMLGPDLSLARLKDGVRALGGLSKKALAKLEKRYNAEFSGKT